MGVGPSLSVVIPVKDDAVMLAQCLSLLGGQTVRPLEIVVVDNNCADDSVRVAADHGARVVVEPAPGIPAAAAAGYDAAAGTVVVRCDADSAPPAHWLERIRDAFTADPSLDALVGTADFYGLSRPWVRAAGALYLQSYLLGMRPVFGHVPLWGSNMAFRRYAWQEVSAAVHRDDPQLHDDVDLSFHFGPHRTIRYDPRLRVGISPRSLYGIGQNLQRLDRARRTVVLHWAAERPWQRWHRRAGRSAGKPEVMTPVAPSSAGRGYG
jgi:glycosyltransferase involved in cell wall biosynthesis